MVGPNWARVTNTPPPAEIIDTPPDYHYPFRPKGCIITKITSFGPGGVYATSASLYGCIKRLYLNASNSPEYNHYNAYLPN